MKNLEIIVPRKFVPHKVRSSTCTLNRKVILVLLKNTQLNTLCPSVKAILWFAAVRVSIKQLIKQNLIHALSKDW